MTNNESPMTAKQMTNPQSSRRSFLRTAALAPLLATQPALAGLPGSPAVVRPGRLRPGDVVGLCCPAAPAYHRETVQITIESMQALGLSVKLSPHFYDRYGYLAGRDAERAADLHALFADPTVSAIMAMHGGYGCARLLPLLDYDLIRQNPKILIGYSDITALLNGIHAQTGLVTMHGPEGAATWNAFTVDHLRQLLMLAETPTLQNPALITNGLTQTVDRITTIRPGRARGQLMGGNLTVLCHLVGSPYVPDPTGRILFLEDTHEDIYSIDRMLTHLRLAGILGKAAGIVFGKFTDSRANTGGYGSLTLDDVFSDIIAPLGMPAFAGSMIGHITDKFTVPLGINAEIDAAAGTIKLLEPGVL
jgi:muramoyltetrapeptide carboxypeptidase